MSYRFFKIISIIILFAVCLNKINGQNIMGAINVGMNATQVDGDMLYGYHKFGWNIGPSAIIPLGKFSVTLETIFDQKGSYQKPYPDIAYTNKDTGMYKLNLTYVEIPLLINYTDKDYITFGTGVSWAKLVNVEEWEQGKKIETTTIQSGVYKQNDWDVLVDVRLRIYKNLKFNFRYAYSIGSIRTRTFNNGVTRHQFNNVLTFRLVWIFNEKNIKKNFFKK